ncbi:MAG: T9SS type A sorting domain-containing protein [Lewinellaceae bacterium]|nr:T9SS type A sorting domain-containing protein [Lewinellaceae bacterium]
MRQNLSIFPQPAVTWCQFSDEISGTWRMRMINNLGVMVCNRSVFHPENGLSVEDFPDGLYYLYLDSPDKQYVGKLLIQH